MTSSVRVLALLAALFSPAALLAQVDPMTPPTASNAPQHSAGSRAATQESGGVSNENMQAMRDKMFLRKAAEGGIAEVELGKLAAQKASDEEVKSFGQKMVDDHTELNKDIASTADSVGVMLPKKMGKGYQANYDKLSSLSGEDFDREYITLMVKDHHEDLRDYRTEANDTTDPDLKAILDRGASVIRQHMIAIDRIARAKGIPMPGHGPRPGTPAAQPAPPASSAPPTNLNHPELTH